MTTQEWITIGIVAIAAAWLLRVFVRQFTAKKGGGCGSCSHGEHSEPKPSQIQKLS